MEPIPPPVLRADRVHHEILERVVFSRHLNPRNGGLARAAFEAGATAPPFAYEPLSDADEILRALDAVAPPTDHAAGVLVAGVMAETRLMVRALRDRTPERFDELARAADWYPSAEDLALKVEPGAREEGRANLTASRLIASLREALVQRGLHDWRIEEDNIMSARVLVDGAKRVLRVHPDAWFRPRDLVRLVVHEIDVHAMRSANGRLQALRCFSTGLPGSLLTEEGLALVAEEHAGVAAPGGLARQQQVVRAIDHARTAGFREVYERLAREAGADLAWGITQRIKRGLARPELPGTYAKDSVYLRGYRLVRRWLDQGGATEHLYVGKVGVQDPVAAWLADGWVQPAPLPALWRPKPQVNRPG